MRHTRATRRRIAASQRERHERAHVLADPRARAETYLAIRRAIMALEASPAPVTPILRSLYEIAYVVAPDRERPRWRKRLEIAQAGRRVYTTAATAQVVAGDDLRDLNRIRSAATVADLIED